jgi:hypothetical protein
MKANGNKVSYDTKFTLAKKSLRTPHNMTARSPTT